MGYPKKILVADDEAITRALVRAFLQKHNYEAEMCTEGLEAWEKLKTGEFNLALIDWMMPGLDGIEICKRTREKSMDVYIYIILLTAKETKQDIVTALDAGADDFITKPFNEEELRSRIQVGERIISLESRLAGKIDELEKALKEVKQLQDLIPICMYCKKVRDDKDFWHQVDYYIQEHAGVNFSHGVCPDCMEKIVKPEMDKFMKDEEKSDENINEDWDD